MRLHRFNPEHEICLASGKANFTPPHAASRLRSGLGWIPALWADKGDIVIVDDVEYAVKASSRWRGKKSDVLFLTFADLKKMLRHVNLDTLQLGVEPWGWDLPVRQQLMRHGIPASKLPSLKRMETIRALAHRGVTIELLSRLTASLPGTVGERHLMERMDDVDVFLHERGSMVLKSPWSSSGRGVRYVSEQLEPTVRSWAEGVIARQGCLIVEPCYAREMDFALEFEMEKSEARFLGFSLFETHGTAYQGNWLATEEKKRERLSRYIDAHRLSLLIEEVSSACASLLRGSYKGPFGIDMMVVRTDEGVGHLIHPCIEMNLRRTMGHVALGLTPAPMEPEGVMYIAQGVNAELKIDIDRPFVKVY